MDLSLISETVKLALFAAAIFISNIVQALTGFAGVMISLPPTILLYGPDMAKAVICIVSWLVCAFVFWQNRRFVLWRESGKIIFFMLVGMAIGLYLYDVIDASVLVPFYGMIIIAAALKNLLLKPSTKALPAWLAVAILLGAGIIHGLFVSGGALLVLYLAQAFREKSVFRANASAVWTVLNIFLMFSDFEKGLFNAECLYLTAISLPPLILAVYLGNKIHDRVNQKMFNRVTYGLLLMAGAMILV